MSRREVAKRLNASIVQHNNWALNCQHCETAPVDWDDPEAVEEHSCAACWAEIISPQPDHAWRNEIAMQAGMGFGCQGYNDAMGY